MSEVENMKLKEENAKPKEENAKLKPKRRTLNDLNLGQLYFIMGQLYFIMGKYDIPHDNNYTLTKEKVVEIIQQYINISSQDIQDKIQDEI